MKAGKAAVKAEKKEMKAAVKAMTPPSKSKPGVSPNPAVTGGTRSVPKAGMGGLLGGMAPKTTKPVAKPAMVQPKPLIRSTAKPAMPGRAVAKKAVRGR